MTITASGSYMLTGNLFVAADLDGILVTASYVSLNLNGFVIEENSLCNGTGSTLICESGTGSGIFASSSPTGLTIRDGTIRNHRFIGIRAEGTGHHFTGVLTRHNGADGINMEFQSCCHRCTSIENQGDGIRVNAGSIVETGISSGNRGEGIQTIGRGVAVVDSTSRSNGGTGIQIDGQAGVVSGSTAENNQGPASCFRSSRSSATTTSRPPTARPTPAAAASARPGAGSIRPRRRSAAPRPTSPPTVPAAFTPPRPTS